MHAQKEKLTKDKHAALHALQQEHARQLAEEQQKMKEQQAKETSAAQELASKETALRLAAEDQNCILQYSDQMSSAQLERMTAEAQNLVQQLEAEKATTEKIQQQLNRLLDREKTIQEELQQARAEAANARVLSDAWQAQQLNQRMDEEERQAAAARAAVMAAEKEKEAARRAQENAFLEAQGNENERGVKQAHAYMLMATFLLSAFTATAYSLLI